MTPSERAFQRDRPATAFSRILDAFVLRHERMRAAVFVDPDGECVDYCATFEPYEAMVFGATWLLAHSAVLACAQKLDSGAVRLWTVDGDTETVLVRRVTDDLLLVMLLDPGGVTAHVLQDLSEVSHQLRMEAGYQSERWEITSEPWLGREFKRD